MNAASSTNSLWDFFPLIMCVTLRERPERTAESREILAKAGIPRVVYYKTERQEDRDKAIMDSHAACMRYLIEKNVPYALIFEDDISFNADPAEHLPHIIDFLKTHRWNIFHFGAFAFKKVEQVTPHIVRGGMLTTHAYAITREFAQEYVSHLDACPPMSVDLLATILAGDNAHVYLDPMLCLQRPSASDGTWDKTNRAAAGWLTKAMVFTGLSWRDRWHYRDLPFAEKIKVCNGMTFFKFYRASLKKKLAKAEAAARSAATPPKRDPGPVGEFVLEEFASSPSIR